MKAHTAEKPEVYQKDENAKLKEELNKIAQQFEDDLALGMQAAEYLQRVKAREALKGGE
jgi:hypothetical protein